SPSREIIDGLLKQIVDVRRPTQPTKDQHFRRTLISGAGHQRAERWFQPEARTDKMSGQQDSAVDAKCLNRHPSQFNRTREMITGRRKLERYWSTCHTASALCLDVNTKVDPRARH